MEQNDSIRRSIRAKALSIGLAISPFGLAFGALCADAGISMWEAFGFSALVFGGSSQFAAVTVLADDGTCLLYTSPSPRDQRGSRMPSSA